MYLGQQVQRIPKYAILPLIPEDPTKLKFLIKIFFKVYLFIFRDRDSMNGGVGERERIPSRLLAASTEPNAGLQPMNHQDHDLSQNQESDA